MESNANGIVEPTNEIVELTVEELGEVAGGIVLGSRGGGGFGRMML